MKHETPWTQEEVERLNERQFSGFVHPYTCDRRANECEVKQSDRHSISDGTLLATKDGWVCPCGKYKQNWY